MSDLRHWVRVGLLLCGVVSSAYYVAMNVYVPTQWEGYSVTSQVPSELSAIDAPTRALWVRLGVAYTVMIFAFGVGIWMSAGERRALRVVGAMIVANGLISAAWPPMHMRGADPTLTDVLHVAFGVAWLAFMLTAMGFGAAALGPRFRRYTWATVAVFVVFGVLTSLGGAGIARNRPTPWVGVWERVNIFAGMAWLSVLSVSLLRRATSSPRAPGPPAAGRRPHDSHR